LSHAALGEVGPNPPPDFAGRPLFAAHGGNIEPSSIFSQAQCLGHLNLFSSTTPRCVSIKQNAAQLLKAQLTERLRTWGAKAKLAKDLGLDPAAVSHWIKGRNSPGLDWIGPIADSLGIRVATLFETRDQARQAGTGNARRGEGDEASGAQARVVKLEEENRQLREKTRKLEAVIAGLEGSVRRYREASGETESANRNEARGRRRS